MSKLYPSPRQNRKWSWIILAAFWAAVGIIYVLTRPTSIGSAAQDAVIAFYSGEAGIIHQHLWEEDIKANHLDRAKIRDIYEQVIFPHQRGFRVCGSPHSQVMGNGDEGVAWVELCDAQNHKYEYGITLWRADGAFRRELQHSLRHAWMIDYVAREDKPLTQENIAAATVKGLEADMPKLASLGVNFAAQMRLEEGDVQIRPLSDVLSSWQKRLAGLTVGADQTTSTGGTDSGDTGNRAR